jgi:uncharacterized membrane protein
VLFVGSLLAAVERAHLALLALALVLALHPVVARSTTPPARMVWLLLASGLACLLVPEVLYVRDEFDGGPLYRMNTVFKLDYQAWILLAPVAGFGIFEGVAAFRVRPVLRYAGPALAAIAVVLIGGGLVYTVTAIPGRTEGFAAEVTTLDGIQTHRVFRPDDIAAIEWLRDNVEPGEVIVEASGRTWGPSDGGPVVTDQRIDYTDAARYSAFTGFPTVLGWPGHELQWRGSGDPLAGRLDDIDNLYLSDSPAEALGILRKYGARYVVVGSREMQDYPQGLDKFQQFMNLVFESGPVRIYELRQTAPASVLQPESLAP